MCAPLIAPSQLIFYLLWNIIEYSKSSKKSRSIGLLKAVKMRKIHKFLWLFLSFSVTSEIFSVTNVNNESNFTPLPSTQSEYIREEAPPTTHLEGSRLSALCSRVPGASLALSEFTSCWVLSFISCSFKLTLFCNSWYSLKVKGEVMPAGGYRDGPFHMTDSQVGMKDCQESLSQFLPISIQAGKHLPRHSTRDLSRRLCWI